MENLTYTKESIELILNTIDSFEFKGFRNADKLVLIYQILNNPVRQVEDEKSSG